MAEITRTLTPARLARPPSWARRAVIALLLFLTAGAVHAARFSRVVVDPGHGGHDSGARFGHLYEKHLALDVSFRLRRFLEGQGLKVVLTRENDTFLPLGDRSRVANRLSRSIFVSIHFNHASYSGPAGTETFFHNAEGQKLASHIQAHIAHNLRTPNRGVKQARFKVLRECEKPAVLVEGGFISTGADRGRTLDPRYRQLLAESIGRGILSYRSR